MVGLSENTNLSWPFLERHPEELNDKLWVMEYLSWNPNLVGGYVERHPEGINGQPWNIKPLSSKVWKLDRFKRMKGVFQ